MSCIAFRVIFNKIILTQHKLLRGIVHDPVCRLHPSNTRLCKFQDLSDRSPGAIVIKHVENFLHYTVHYYVGIIMTVFAVVTSVVAVVVDSGRTFVMLMGLVI